MPAGLEVAEDNGSDDEEEGGEGDKKKRSSRAVVKDVRLRVRRAMQQEQIDSDESDKDFGFNAQNPEEEDVQLDSAEVDSASDVEHNPVNQNDPEVKNQTSVTIKDEKEQPRTKKRKRSDPKGEETTTTAPPIKTENPESTGRRPRINLSETTTTTTTTTTDQKQ